MIEQNFNCPKSPDPMIWIDFPFTVQKRSKLWSYTDIYINRQSQSMSNSDSKQNPLLRSDSLRDRRSEITILMQTNWNSDVIVIGNRKSSCFNIKPVLLFHSLNAI